MCGARLQPVLDTIEKLHKSGVWLEVTTLVIPELNDDKLSLQFIASFIASIDPSIPWHISRFFPTYKMVDRPPTPVQTLKLAEKIGREAVWGSWLETAKEKGIPGEEWFSRYKAKVKAHTK